MVFDDRFHTVPGATDVKQTGVRTDDSTWSELFENGRDRYIDDDYDSQGRPLPMPRLHDDWLSPEEKAERRQRLRDTEGRTPGPIPTVGAPEGAGDGVGTPEGADDGFGAPEGADDGVDTHDDEPPSLADHDSDSDDEDEPSPPRTRAGRRYTPWHKRYGGHEWTKTGRSMQPPPRVLNSRRQSRKKGYHARERLRKEELNESYLASLDWTQVTDGLRSGETEHTTWSLFQRLMHENTDPRTGEVDWMSPIALAANASSKDNPRLARSHERTLCRGVLAGR